MGDWNVFWASVAARVNDGADALKYSAGTKGRVVGQGVVRGV